MTRSAHFIRVWQVYIDIADTELRRDIKSDMMICSVQNALRQLLAQADKHYLEQDEEKAYIFYMR